MGVIVEIGRGDGGDEVLLRSSRLPNPRRILSCEDLRAPSVARLRLPSLRKTSSPPLYQRYRKIGQ